MAVGDLIAQGPEGIGPTTIYDTSSRSPPGDPGAPPSPSQMFPAPNRRCVAALHVKRYGGLMPRSGAGAPLAIGDFEGQRLWRWILSAIEASAALTNLRTENRQPSRPDSEALVFLRSARAGCHPLSALPGGRSGPGKDEGKAPASTAGLPGTDRQDSHGEGSEGDRRNREVEASTTVETGCGSA